MGSEMCIRDRPQRVRQCARHIALAGRDARLVFSDLREGLQTWDIASPDPEAWGAARRLERASNVNNLNVVALDGGAIASIAPDAEECDTIALWEGL